MDNRIFALGFPILIYFMIQSNKQYEKSNIEKIFMDIIAFIFAATFGFGLNFILMTWKG